MISESGCKCEENEMGSVQGHNLGGGKSSDRIYSHQADWWIQKSGASEKSRMKKRTGYSLQFLFLCMS